jgi:hypothetical protein
MFNPNRNFQQQQNQAQQKQFQNASNQANNRQQQQAIQTANQWARNSRARATKQIQDGWARNRAIEAEQRRRRAAYAQLSGDPPESGWQGSPNYRSQYYRATTARRSVTRPSSWRKRVGVTILIIAAVLTLAAILGTQNSSVTPNGTQGVITADANIRLGPGTGNSVAAVAPAETRVVISCAVKTPAGTWDKLSSPYRGMFVSATLVHSQRPAPC